MTVKLSNEIEISHEVYSTNTQTSIKNRPTVYRSPLTVLKLLLPLFLYDKYRFA
jgi:hypothetical protein